MKKRYHFRTIDSTSSYLKREYARFGDFTFVSADYQTKGRGRMERVWNSPKKQNLMFSFLLRDSFFLENYASVSLLCGYCVVRLFEKLGIRDVSVKWPNDVYIGGKKACGILLEGISSGGKMDAMVVGIGINVNEYDFPEGLNATSVALEKKRFVSLFRVRHLVYSIILEEFSSYRNGTSPYLEEVRKRNFLKGKTVKMDYQGKEITATVLDVDENNAIIVECGGETLHLSSGEANLVK